ncbi:hypothetical protein GCM10011490_05290 [Pseudoclavibacter endophyticus]|uniref:Peptidoglycan DD-metalloendopeptidase family protein n=1 Tax=Pseudoclavibacter endophyticus TaxID=1778590 RepID=A0A6H9WUV1_9MICO|nr:M23 family metallopeptidase [Pseudoclavibacter endophyticus]KAB1649970.1 peptidoglycan DD-metalloendopeptidase family protein [Pseudoclavibacter endophyticus]GGA58325.1 hypothetical protein GCM10011490_05290 [Pseudoclavibacter endophyticus]
MTPAPETTGRRSAPSATAVSPEPARAWARGRRTHPLTAALAGIVSVLAVCVPVVANALTVRDGGDIDLVAEGQQARAPHGALVGLPVGEVFRADTGLGVSTGAADGYTEGVVQWPLASRDATVTSRFGPRVSPCGGCSSNHRGVDFAGPVGVPVGSIADGHVISASYGDNGGLGIHVVVEHAIDGRTVQSVYAHLDHGSVTVRVGDAVDVGERVGSLGNTGASTGPHLHLETIVDGVHVDPLNFLYRYADGRDVEITDRPSLPWASPEPGAEGEGWTPDQTVTTYPPGPTAPAPVEVETPEPAETSAPSVPGDTGDTPGGTEDGDEPGESATGVTPGGEEPDAPGEGGQAGPSGSSPGEPDTE